MLIVYALPWIAFFVLLDGLMHIAARREERKRSFIVKSDRPIPPASFFDRVGHA